MITRNYCFCGFLSRIQLLQLPLALISEVQEGGPVFGLNDPLLQQIGPSMDRQQCTIRLSLLLNGCYYLIGRFALL